MSAEALLQDAVDQWLLLAGAEGEAIRARDWTSLAACQQALRELQTQLTHHLGQARQQWAGAGSDQAAKEQFFQSRALELMELEKRNGALLEEMRIVALSRRDRLHQASRLLGRLRASYAPAPASVWTCLS